MTALRAKVESDQIPHLRVEKLDLLDPFDVQHAFSFSFDILVNNAGIAEGGPIAEIPMDLVRRNFETNVFAPLAFTQQVVKRWVREKTAGKLFPFLDRKTLEPARICRLRGDQACGRGYRRSDAA